MHLPTSARFIGVLAASMLAAPALAQDTPATAVQAELLATADAATATAATAQIAADQAQVTADLAVNAGGIATASEAQIAANTAQTTADTADLLALEAIDAANAFTGRIRTVRVLKNLSQQYLAEANITVTVDGDADIAVDQIRMSFGDTGAGSAPLTNPVILTRSNTRFDARGTLQLNTKVSVAPVVGAPYAVTITLADADGVLSEAVTLTDVVVGEKLTGRPIVFNATTYQLAAVGWSEDVDCRGCPLLALTDANDDPTSPDVSRAPRWAKFTATSLDPNAPGTWVANFSTFSTTADFTQEAVAFSGDPLGVRYQTTSVMLNADLPIGEPTATVVVVELDEDNAVPVAEPTLVLDGVVSGSISVNDGDYVVLSGTVEKNVVVNGGVLRIEGGVVGRDLRLKGGELILDGADIGRSLKARAGRIEVMQAVVGHNLRIRGAVEIAGDAASMLRVRHDLTGRATGSVQLGSNLEVGGKIALTSVAGGLTVDGNIRAEGGVLFRANSDTGLVVNGDVAGGGNIRLRNGWPNGGLVVNGSITAEADVDMRTSGGGITLDGPITANDIKLHIRRGGGALVVNDSIEAVGEVEMRVAGGDVTIDGTVGGTNIYARNKYDGYGDFVVNGSITAVGEVDMRVGGNVEINGTITAAGDINWRTRGSDGDVNDAPGREVIINGAITSGAVFRYRRRDRYSELVVNGSINANDDIDMRIRNGDLVVNGSITAVGEVDMRIRNGDLVVNGSISANDDIDMRIRNSDLVVNGSISANDDIDMRVGGGTTVGPNGTLSAVASNIVLRSGGETTINGVMTAQGALSVDTPATLTLGGSLSASQGSVSVQARGLVGLYTFDDAAGQDSSRRIHAGADININAVDSLELAGIELSADGSIHLLAAVFHSDEAYPSPDGTLATTVYAGGDIDLEVSQSLSLRGGYAFGPEGIVWTATEAQTITIEGPGSLFFDGATGEVTGTLNALESVLTDPGGLLAAVSPAEG